MRISSHFAYILTVAKYFKVWIEYFSVTMKKKFCFDIVAVVIIIIIIIIIIESKSPQISRTLLSILADYSLNVLYFSSDFYFLMFLSKFLETICKVQITIYIRATFIFYNFFSSMTRFGY